MSLENVKVGDWIKVQVTEINTNEDYPIRCSDGLSFTKLGAYYSEDKQIAFQLEPTERWMMVSNDSIIWHKRKVFMTKNNKFIAWLFGETDEEVNKSCDAESWKLAKEIEPKIEFNLELSLEEIAEKFGVNVEQIKIKK